MKTEMITSSPTPNTTNKIFALPRSVVHLIAAGEVAERPSLIIKELLENSLDAEATRIDVVLEDSGMTKILVSDDGTGIDADDLHLAVQRHTTSKIRSEKDLEKVLTFGFRGEALASIASVSHMSLQSRTRYSEIGHRLVIENDVMIEETPIGIPPGTSVLIEQLFQNFPARLKFLRNPQAELKKILQILIQASLGHPRVSFSLTNNQRTLLQLPAHHAQLERVHAVLGAHMHAALIPFQADHTFLQLQGFLGKPQLARKTAVHQYLFVNNRPVSHQGISQVLKEAYGSLLEPRANPVFILHLTLPPHLTDVNVHPRKELVQFMDEPQVLELLRQTLEKTLKTTDLTYTPSGTSFLRVQDSAGFSSLTPEGVGAPESSFPLSPTSLDRKASPITSTIMKSTVAPWLLATDTTTPEILQLHDTYLVTQTPDGFILVDQHAAHERIIFEQFSAALRESAKQIEQFELAKSFVLQLSLSDAQVLSEHLETLQQTGFEIEHLGGEVFRISKVPVLLKDRSIAKLFQEFIDDLTQGKPLRGVDTIAQRTIAYLACHSAIKAGDPLSADQKKQLLEKLAQTENAFTCPHGRPTQIAFSIKDLEKMFHRR